MQKYFLISILLFVNGAVFSQDLDGLVCFSDLNFSSIFEEMVFSQLEQGEEPALADLFLAMDVRSESEASRYKAELNALAHRLEKQDIVGKKAKKQVKILYADTHEALMQKYDAEAFLPDLFRDGSFNCVTGTMVYVLLFSEFGIPYSIQKGQNHVSLVAYPDSHTLLLESTDAEGGVRSMGMGDKQHFVDNLSRGKLISAEERAQSSITVLFTQYAFEESQIDELELASYQFFNRAVFHVQELDFEQAFYDFEKAFYLKPGRELSAMVLQSGAQILHRSDYSDSSHYHLLTKLARYKEYGITDEMVLAEFARITEKVYHDRNDEEAYDQAYTILQSRLTSEEVKRKISLAYYGTIVEELLTDGKMNAALPYLEKIYSIDPDDRQVQNLIRDILLENLSNAMITPPEQLAFLDRYRTSMPGIYEMPLIKLVDMHVLLANSCYWYDRGVAEQGRHYLDQFETHLEGLEDLSMLNTDIETAYESAAFFYYERGQIRSTRVLLDRGLKILPNSFKLKRLRSSI